MQPVKMVTLHDIARYLITQNNCNPEYSSIDGETPLHAACSNGQLSLARYLITQYSCNPECPIEMMVRLHYACLACLSGHLDMARYLFNECNCSPWCRSNDGWTPLHQACFHGHLDIAIYLTSQCNCNPQDPTNAGMTSLHTACRNGHIDIAEYLISQCKCNPQCHDKIGQTPLLVACLNGHLDIAKYLMSQCNYNPHKPNNHGVTPLHAACQNGHLDIAKYLISQCNCNPQCPINDGQSPLYLACLYGHIDIAKYLIQCGCDPQFLRNDGSTPLHQACFNGHLDMATYLITKCSCNPECHNNDGLTPLHVACQYGHIDIAKFLISQGSCNPQCCGNDSETPLYLACLNGHLETAKYLITQHNCNPECRNNRGFTPLHSACYKGNLDIVKYLTTECLCNPNCIDNVGRTPLHYACLESCEEIVRYLVSSLSCNPLQSDKFAFTAVRIAIAKAPSVAEIIKNYYNCVIRYPIESYTKVFTVGDVHVGKSTLVKSLQQNPGIFSSFFGQVFEQHVTGVSAATAGIESFAINSEGFGNVVIHDFAGDYEYYTSQAAFLQSFTSQMAGLFLIVVNCQQTKNEVIESLKYWMSFIQECWGHNVNDSEMNAHVIIVGSHADKVSDIDSKYEIIFEEVLSSPLYGIKYDGAVCLDCRKPSSPELGHLHHLLDTACTILTNKGIKMDGRCYILFEHLQTNYVKRGLPVCILNILSDTLRQEDHPLLPHTPNELLPLLKALHDKGQLVLLENEKEDHCLVICQKAIFLQEIVGKIFAPPGHKEHVEFSSTGVVSHSKIEKAFPHLNYKLVIDFMKHFEFCHAIDNPNKLIDQCRTGGS